MSSPPPAEEDEYLEVKRRSTNTGDMLYEAPKVKRDSAYDVSATASWTPSPPRSPTASGASGDGFDEYLGFPWWAGAMTRDEADIAMCQREPGSFLVRVSARPGSGRGRPAAQGSADSSPPSPPAAARTRLAVTVAIDPVKRQTLHIAVFRGASGVCEVDGQEYASMSALLASLAREPYRGIPAAALATSAPRLPPPRASPGGSLSPPGSPKLRRAGSDLAPPPVPPRSTTGGLDFESDAIYLSPSPLAAMRRTAGEGPYDRPSATEDEEGPYDRPGATETEEGPYDRPSAAEGPYSDASAFATLPRRPRMSASLPISVGAWSAGDVQRWCRDNGLEAFCKPLYSNGVTGVELVHLHGDIFPAKRFTATERRAFDAAIQAAVARSKAAPVDVDTDKSQFVASRMLAGPPPVPARSFVSG